MDNLNDNLNEDFNVDFTENLNETKKQASDCLRRFSKSIKDPDVYDRRYD